MTAGFGLQKLGLVSLRYPWLCLAIAVLVTPLLAYGASQLQFSSDIREIFRSGDPAFDQLDIVEERFPDVQRDIHVVVSSDEPFDLKDLKTLKRLDQELGGLAGVRSVLSMFSAIQEPEEGGRPEAHVESAGASNRLLHDGREQFGERLGDDIDVDPGQLLPARAGEVLWPLGH